MWNCDKCGRIFERKNQSHTCLKVPMEQHFQNKHSAQVLFDQLTRTINEKIGSSQIVSLPCCIHLFGKYDFLAVLPKKDRLEIRFSLNRKIVSTKLKQSIPISLKGFKYCVDIKTTKDIDVNLMMWLNDAYYLKKAI